jgi:hypothetical protein
LSHGAAAAAAHGRPAAAWSRRSLALLALAAAALALPACGAEDAGGLEVGLAKLVAKPDVYQGDAVVASGRVERAKPGFALRDDSGSAVALRTDRDLAGRVGRSVTVEGVFGRDLSGNPYISVDRIG